MSALDKLPSIGAPLDVDVDSVVGVIDDAVTVGSELARNAATCDPHAAIMNVAARMQHQSEVADALSRLV